MEHVLDEKLFKEGKCEGKEEGQWERGGDIKPSHSRHVHYLGSTVSEGNDLIACMCSASTLLTSKG
jgi:hypothetical protein